MTLNIWRVVEEHGTYSIYNGELLESGLTLNEAVEVCQREAKKGNKAAYNSLIFLIGIYNSEF